MPLPTVSGEVQRVAEREIRHDWKPQQTLVYHILESYLQQFWSDWKSVHKRWKWTSCSETWLETFCDRPDDRLYQKWSRCNPWGWFWTACNRKSDVWLWRSWLQEIQWRSGCCVLGQLPGMAQKRRICYSCWCGNAAWPDAQYQESTVPSDGILPVCNELETDQ